jgi:hypothetical protein
MKHPSIVPFLGVADVPGSFGIVTPIMPLGNLRMFLEARLQLDSSTYDRMVKHLVAFKLLRNDVPRRLKA